MTEHRHLNQSQKRRRKMMNISKFNTFTNFGGGVLLSRKEASVRSRLVSETSERRSEA